MNEDAKKSIDKNKEKYFDENRAGIYNKLKSDIRDKIQAKDFDKDILNKKNEQFLKLVDQLAEAKTNYEVAEEKLKQSADKVLTNKIEKKGSLIEEKDQISKKIDEIKNNTETDKKKTKNIPLLNKLIKKQLDIVNNVTFSNLGDHCSLD